MVILIGGVGCTGKTLLASQLMKEAHIPYFPLDHLMMGIYRGMPDCDFTPMDDQFVLGEKIWPIIKGMIMTNIENDHSIILEGFQLLPHLLKDFPSGYLENILPVFLFSSRPSMLLDLPMLAKLSRRHSRPRKIPAIVRVFHAVGRSIEHHVV